MKSGKANGALRAYGLRCEHFVDPLGVDVRVLRLGWVVESEERDQVQTAYQILVASDEKLLKRDKADFWDSGKVESDQTVDVGYGGKELAAHQGCFWKARVWDRQGRVGAWSEVARWSAGIGAAAWEGTKWIGFDRFHQTEFKDAALEGANWIWFEADGQEVGKVSRLFSKMVTLPAGAKVQSAELCITAVDRFTCEIKAAPAAASRNLADWKRPGRFDVTGLLAEGENPGGAGGDRSPEHVGLVAKLTVAPGRGGDGDGSNG